MSAAADIRQQRRDAMLSRIAQLRALEERAAARSGEARPVFDRRGQLLPRERVGLLVDPGAPFLPLCTLAGYLQDTKDGDKSIPGGGAIAGIGYVSGVRCMILADDSGIDAGAVQPMGLEKMLRVQEIALENRLPFVHLVESAGANLMRYKVEGFVRGGGLFRNLARLSAAGLPVISVQHGSGTAGGAYMPGLSDIVILVRGRSRAFLAGPPLLKAATGEIATEEELGGAEMHASTSGLGEYLAEDDRHALGICREVMRRLAPAPLPSSPTGSGTYRSSQRWMPDPVRHDSRSAVPDSRSAVPDSRSAAPDSRSAVPDSHGPVDAHLLSPAHPLSSRTGSGTHGASPRWMPDPVRHDSRSAVPDSRSAAPDSRSAAPDSHGPVDAHSLSPTHPLSSRTGSGTHGGSPRWMPDPVRHDSRSAVPDSRSAAPDSRSAVPDSRSAVPDSPRREHTARQANADALLCVMPASLREPVDMRDVVRALVDDDILEFKPLYGSQTVCAQGTIGGHAVGFITNNGPIDVPGANKATHFIQYLCQLGHPIVYLQNTTGYMVGKDSEQGGMIKHGSKMIQAVANATVPQITVQCGASFGAGNYGMCGRGYAPRFLFSWPSAKTAVMGGEQAARTMQIVTDAALARKGLAADPAESKKQYDQIVAMFEAQADAFHTSGLLLDDGVIDPRDTRDVLAFCLDTIAEAAAKRPNAVQFGVARM